MKLFIIKKNTPIKVIKEGKEWYSKNFKDTFTKHENIFELHDIIVDPLGNIGSTRFNKVTIGSLFAENGYYGFKKDGWVMLVSANNVEVN